LQSELAKLHHQQSGTSSGNTPDTKPYTTPSCDQGQRGNSQGSNECSDSAAEDTIKPFQGMTTPRDHKPIHSLRVNVDSVAVHREGEGDNEAGTPPPSMLPIRIKRGMLTNPVRRAEEEEASSAVQKGGYEALPVLRGAEAKRVAASQKDDDDDDDDEEDEIDPDDPALFVATTPSPPEGAGVPKRGAQGGRDGGGGVGCGGGGGSCPSHNALSLDTSMASSASASSAASHAHQPAPGPGLSPAAACAHSPCGSPSSTESVQGRDGNSSCEGGLCEFDPELWLLYPQTMQQQQQQQQQQQPREPGNLIVCTVEAVEQLLRSSGDVKAGAVSDAWLDDSAMASARHERERSKEARLEERMRNRFRV
jgi:hypothetical protein